MAPRKRYACVIKAWKLSVTAAGLAQVLKMNFYCWWGCHLTDQIEYDFPSGSSEPQWRQTTYRPISKGLRPSLFLVGEGGHSTRGRKITSESNKKVKFAAAKYLTVDILCSFATRQVNLMVVKIIITRCHHDVV